MDRQQILNQIQAKSRQAFSEVRTQALREAVRNMSAVVATGDSSSGGGKPLDPWIELALASMNERYAEVTSLVPNIYLFWDDYVMDGDEPILTGIEDGGDDMYDGANFMNTNLTANWDDIKEGQIDGDTELEMASILYTHTQATNEDDDQEYTNPPMDGEIRSGGPFFGEGSNYFTNMYPGLFLMIADNISVSEFNITGDVGSDEDTINGGDVAEVVPGWTLFYKTNEGDGNDPSINHLILVPGTPAGITHEFEDESGNDYDDHRISGIEDRSRIVYAVVATQPGEAALTESEFIDIAQKLLEVVSA